MGELPVYIALTLLLVETALTLTALGFLAWSMRRQGEMAAAEKAMRSRYEELRRANQAYAHAQEDWDRERARLEAELVELRATGSPARDHSILLMGTSKAGKTTWLARVANPTIERERLARVNRTVHQPRSDRATPIALDTRESSRALLHGIRFYDMAGEMTDQLGGNLDNWLVEVAEAERRGVSPGHAAVLLVWDPTVSEPKKNENRVDIVRAVLGIPRYKRVLAVHVFLNKRDLLSEDAAATEAARVLKLVKDELGGRFDVQISVGSALTGEGVQDCYGKLLRVFELEPLLPSVLPLEGGATIPGA